MARLYTVSFINVTISAAQDLLAVKGSTGKTLQLRRYWWAMNDTTLETAQGVRTNLKFGSATVTLGSGGSGPTPRPIDPGDSAASFTCRANDTTPATTSGSFVNIAPNGGHNYGGGDFNFGLDGPVCGLNQGIILELLSTLSGTCAWSGGMLLAESGL